MKRLSAARAWKWLRDSVLFHTQAWANMRSVGAILPSSRFLSEAVTRHLSNARHPTRILEVGPGVGPVSSAILKHLKAGDTLDLVEMNPVFAELLSKNLETWLNGKDLPKVQVHQCRIQDFKATKKYDYVVSSIPLNTLTPVLVGEIFEAYLKLLTSHGMLSYFEYAGARVTGLRFKIQKNSREKLRELNRIKHSLHQKYRVSREVVVWNVPPAVVYHLDLAS